MNLESTKRNILSYLHDIIYLLAAVLAICLLCFRVVVVSGPSMNRTLFNGDYLLLLNRELCGEIRQGDIVVASKDSFQNGEPIIKRVIATEGQVVDIDFEAGIVFVDGEALYEPYVNTPTNMWEGVNFPVTVKEGHVFVMGDNRNSSKDSRNPDIGQIDCREISGKVILLVFPGLDDLKQRDYSRIGGVS